MYLPRTNQIKFLFTLFIGFYAVSKSQAQSNLQKIEWQVNKNVAIDPEISAKQILNPFDCQNCKEDIVGDFIVPHLVKKLELTNQEVVSFSISNIQTESHGSHAIAAELSTEFETSFHISYEKGRKFGLFKVVPVKKNGNDVEVLTSFEYDIKTKDVAGTTQLKKKKDQTYTSVLTTGEFHKVAVVGNGVYKIDASFLNASGISPSGIDLSTFKIFGNGGVMLPEIIATVRPEDLVENPLFVQDNNGNNQLDGDDYVLWYSNGHDDIRYNTNTSRYEFTSHDFDEAAYYFIAWGNGAGKRISTLPSNQASTPARTITSYEHIITHEVDEVNHIESGRRWWGDNMQFETTKTFTYAVPGMRQGEAISFYGVTAAHALNSTSMTISLTGNPNRSVNYGPISGAYDESFLSGVKSSAFTFTAPANSFDLTFSYNKFLTESAAWIDYFILGVPRNLSTYDNQQTIRSIAAANLGINKFSISNFTSEYAIWDVSDHLNPSIQQTYTDGSNKAFHANNQSGEQPTYVLFKPGAAPNPQYLGTVENQNLHALTGVEYFIITTNELKGEAERLADFHRTNSNLETRVVLTSQIFNEFSSGAQDVTGIRDFLKLMYDRGNDQGPSLKYVCLFGDASYDYKDVVADNTNVVPIYQSYNSYVPASSYCSDDYYAILDDSEGYWGINSVDEGLDIGVGRLPASNSDEAKLMVDKIYHYHSPASFGDWMQRLSFIGDDEDNNAHLGPSEDMADTLYSQYPHFNINKIWLDAYEQVSFGSGNKYPQVNADINKTINNQGTLIFNYVGHGGENGMAHERVITRPEISGWTNYNKLSFYVTASCELARIDKVGLESPGELMLLNPNGGAIGMVATTRLVYIGVNTDLNTEIIDRNIFENNGGKLQTLGNTYMNTRNAAIEQVNKRTFMLIADPAMSLLTPTHQVVTTAINGIPIGQFSDTLKALSLVTIEGEIQDNGNTLLSDFNGTLYPTLYDKFATYQTRGNDPSSKPVEFQLQNSVVYKGKVSVANGKFSFQFIVPKDIAYNIGEGKLSYYAENGITHAGGYDNSIKIGGTSSVLADDKTPPEIDLFIDDESWVFGGNTSNTPLLLARLLDSNGLNTVGSGIGREMEAILDKGTEYEKSIILNDFYTPDVNTYQSGRIEYPFTFVENGMHTLHLKVWDAYNNSAEAYTEFVVQNDEDLSIDHVLNYPNPFSTYTEFHFDHNKAGQNLTVGLTIMSVAGNVVKNITQDILNAPTHSSDIVWDGKDQFGEKLARGVYIYNIQVKAEDGSTANQTQKLFIVN